MSNNNFYPVLKAMPIIITAIFVFSLFSLSILALDEEGIKVQYNPIKNKIGYAEWAEFDLLISNVEPGYGSAGYVAFSLVNDLEGVEWSMLTSPQSVSTIVLRGGESEKIRVLLKDINLPRNYKKPVYAPLILKSRDNAIRKIINLPVYLMPSEIGESPTELSITTNFPENIDPRASQSFKIDIKNNNWNDYVDLKVLVKSADFERDSIIALGPNEAKTVEFTVDFGDGLSPKKETASITLSSGGKILASQQVPYEIILYNIPFEKEEKVSTNFLLVTDSVAVKNSANTEEEQQVLIETGWLKKFISSTMPKANVWESEGRYYHAWTLRLAPGEVFEITVKTNYRLVLYAVLIIALAVFLWFMFKTPIVIVKQAEYTKISHEGISEVDIRVIVQNRSNKEFRDVKLVERVPSLLQMIQKAKHTFLPKHVSTTPKGQLLWWIFDLTPYEERIITYSLKPKFTIIGDLRLPPSLLQYKIGGHHLKSTSNEMNVTSTRR